MTRQLPLLRCRKRCRARGLRTVVGGPIASSLPATELKAEHIVVGEAESLIADLARDLELGAAKPIYQAVERPEMESSPLPDLSLSKMNRYSTIKLEVDDTRIARMKVSGVYRVGDNANFARSLSRLLPVEIRVVDDRIQLVGDDARILQG